MISSIYFILIAVILLFILLIWILKKAAALFKSSFLLLLLLLGFIAAILAVNNSTTVQAAMNSWIHSPVIKANSFLKQHFDVSAIKMKDSVLMDIPAISQQPDLPRGCEVTSLTMLLNSAGIKVTKMELAEKIKREHTPLTISNGQIHFGNPNDGFVGNMYNLNEPGYGVYHAPVAELAENYLPGKIKDLTGSDFEELKWRLSNGQPVWVVTNTTFQKLNDSQFETWLTPSGKISITYKEHSVLLTGYDQQFIYFNDPLTGEKNKKAPIKDFEESWVQMGSQAITYIP